MDPESQVIYTIGASNSREPMLDKVRPLVSRFPDNAFVLATYMRFACMGQIAVRRPEEALLSADKPSTYAVVNNGMLPKTLADYLRAADTGEKLEPDNAYFPWLKCVALFGARRDKEALDTLHRAAGKKRFYEHIDQEVFANWRFTDAAYGDSGAVSRTAATMTTLFPHYAQLRAVTRISTYLAAEKEFNGKRVEGLQIRTDLMNLSALMRLDSNTVIGTLVGAATENIAISRPGGAPPITGKEGDEADAVSKKRRAQYL